MHSPGGAENAGVENAGVENVRADRRGGKCRSGKCGSRQSMESCKNKILLRIKLRRHKDVHAEI